MVIDITDLQYDRSKYIQIDEQVYFNNEQLKEAKIIELKDVKVIGDITKTSIQSFKINIIIKGVMVLPCSITLKPVDYSFSISIEDDLHNLLEEINENYKNNSKTIDIFPIIWENILMEIPIKVISDDLTDANKEGEGWKLI